MASSIDEMLQTGIQELIHKVVKKHTKELEHFITDEIKKAKQLIRSEIKKAVQERLSTFGQDNMSKQDSVISNSVEDEKSKPMDWAAMVETSDDELEEPAEEVEPTEKVEPAEEVEPTEKVEPAEEVEPTEKYSKSSLPYLPKKGYSSKPKESNLSDRQKYLIEQIVHDKKPKAIRKCKYAKKCKYADNCFNGHDGDDFNLNTNLYGFYMDYIKNKASIDDIVDDPNEEAFCYLISLIDK